MAKVLVLGSAGIQGSGVARLLSGYDEVSQLVLADINEERVQALANELEADAVPVKVDVTDPDALISLMSTVDLVANLVGPYFKYGVAPATAAIRAGCDYIDIMDEAGLVQDYIDLDGQAREAGVTVVSGMGLSPGFLNLQGVHAAAQLDEAVEIQYSYLATPSLEGVAEHIWSHRAAMYGTVQVVRDGEVLDEPGGGDVEDIDWPGVGVRPVALSSHPEPLMTGHHLKHIRDSSIKVGQVSEEFARLMWLLGRSGLVSSEPIEFRGSSITPFDFTGAVLASNLFKDSATYASTVAAKEEAGDFIIMTRARAVGTKDGQPAAAVCTFSEPESMWRAVYTPAAIGALTMIRGQAKRPGVNFPEFFDATAVLAELSGLGMNIETTLE